MADLPTARDYGVLYLIGRDRVGILQEASSFVSERGAAIEQGISHTLSTEAVVLLYVSGTAPQLELIRKDAPKLGDALQLLVMFTPIKGTDPNHDHDALPLTLRVSVT